MNEAAQSCVITVTDSAMKLQSMSPFCLWACRDISSNVEAAPKTQMPVCVILYNLSKTKSMQQMIFFPSSLYSFHLGRKKGFTHVVLKFRIGRESNVVLCEVCSYLSLRAFTKLDSCSLITMIIIVATYCS